jgi:hypothetical protein
MLIGIDFRPGVGKMQSVKLPPQIVVSLGEDFNWWLAPTPDEPDAPAFAHGILDPRQVRELTEQLAEYLSPEWFAKAFHLYAVQAEIAEGMLQLRAYKEGDELFALPAIDEDSDGPYFDFLDALGKARIRRLNAKHRRCTLEEMQDELDALDHDRYFDATTMHAFDQINEILQWSPAEWDQP